MAWIEVYGGQRSLAFELTTLSPVAEVLAKVNLPSFFRIVSKMARITSHSRAETIIVDVYHLHGGTGRFTVWESGLSKIQDW